MSENDDVLFVPWMRSFKGNYSTLATLAICILIIYRNSKPKKEMETAADNTADENTLPLCSSLFHHRILLPLLSFLTVVLVEHK
jgi:hypothetical protein